ncbi:MAG: ribonuclease III [Ruminococcaceae bacterium]|nr:ribonuclease III [Oscillospiraceae bacterium]
MEYPVSFTQKTQELQNAVGYTFKNPVYMYEALTHSSFSNEQKSRHKDYPCNERLEFLGDSVLSFVVSDYIFNGIGRYQEGDLTKIRSAAVCEDACFEYAKKFELGKYMLLGKGEENAGGRERKSILADAFEAFLAAVFMDGGIEPAREFLLPYIKKSVNRIISNGNLRDYKTLLQQFVQQNKGDILEYRPIGESGPDHNKVFEVEVSVNNNVIGKGKGSSKREAEQSAARAALELFGQATND